jgi:hypothetical protein
MNTRLSQHVATLAAVLSINTLIVIGVLSLFGAPAGAASAGAALATAARTTQGV